MESFESLDKELEKNPSILFGIIFQKLIIPCRPVILCVYGKYAAMLICAVHAETIEGFM